MLLVYSKDSVKFIVQPGDVNPCQLKECISGTLFDKFKIEIIFLKIRKRLGDPLLVFAAHMHAVLTSA